MGMKLGLVREAFSPPENQSWLGSAHGTTEAEPITLDGDEFLATFDDGVIPSGVALGKVTATDKYVPYDDGGTDDGRRVCVGFLFTTVDLGGTTAGTVGDTAAALLWHGQVVEDNLPTDNGLDAAAKTDLAGHFHFV
jgi:hypothetical protein